MPLGTQVESPFLESASAQSAETPEPAVLASTHPLQARWPRWRLGRLSGRPCAYAPGRTVTAETWGGLDRILHAEPAPVVHVTAA